MNSVCVTGRVERVWTNPDYEDVNKLNLLIDIGIPGKLLKVYEYYSAQRVAKLSPGAMVAVKGLLAKDESTDWSVMATNIDIFTGENLE